MTSLSTPLVPRSRSRRPVRVRRSGGWFRRLVASPIVWLVVAANAGVVVWILFSSVKDTRSILESPWSLPSSLHLDNYARAWTSGDFAAATFNSVVLVVGTAAATVLLAAPAAYALTRLGGRGSSGLTAFFAVGLGVPSFAVFLPLYVVMSHLGLVNNLAGLWLLYTATSMPFAVFFLTAFFRSLPQEVEEAAALDGASPLYVFWRIVFPLARSGIITLLILNVIQHWGETFFALVFIQDRALQTLPLALYNFLQTMQYSGADWAGMFAGIALVVVPMIVAYAFLARQIIDGMTLGAGK
ncbi:carbohydrate ABC transporter permease [Luteimicrobium xylanilyticum]|uniref:ABC transporter permease protein ORF1 n=1 Tax=Luteimicrobium xylanilyticum TaxID=1133546 RepID=A0A5P9QCB6_9MICO|nr:carbohydrate ABC transporter permease [Luteimicrobium xylanilyticum]QFU98780.1 Putative ABC transporter permease protein ORF1 [Luteimicrobium xylanilyticum]